MYVTQHPLTFSDLSKAVQRSAGLAGLGQCPDGTLDCLPVETQPSGGGLLPVTSGESSTAISPYYTTIGGLQISNSTLVIGGIIAAIALGAAFLGGARR